MSQYGANYYQEQQPQGPYNYQQNQTQGHYLTEQSSYGPPPYTEQSYPQGQDQHYNNSGYDQRYGAMADMPQGANASYYNGESLSNSNGNDVPEGEKGLGSTVVGGAAGGYMGHKMGGGWSTAAGAALGAVGANVVSHKMKPQPAPVQQVVAAPQLEPVQPVQYVATPAVGCGGMGLIGRRRALLSNRAAYRGRFGL